MGNKRFAIIIIGFIYTYTLYTQSEIPAFDFLRVETGAKASALAGAFDTYTDDPNAMFYNMGSISTITKSKISAGFGKYLLDINFGTITYAQKYKNLGWFGIGVKFFDYGTFNRGDENGVQTGETFGANDLMVSLGYGNFIYDKINYGIAFKYIYSSIAEYKSSAIAFDFGIQYHIQSSQLSLGFSINNIGTQLNQYISTKEKLPLDIRIGISKKLEHTPVRINLTFSKLNEKREKLIKYLKSFSIGAEFIFSENVSARLGYDNENRQDMKLGSTLGISGFSTGIGFRIAERYLFDYSLNSFGKTGSTHRVNLGYIFNLNNKGRKIKNVK